MITRKDWQIINAALAYYDSELVGSDDEECTRLNFLAESHKETYGDIDKTMQATRTRVARLMQKKGIEII